KDHVAAVETTQPFGCGYNRWHHSRTIVRHGLVVAVIELETLRGRAVDEHDAKRVGLLAHAPDTCRLRLAQALDHTCNGVTPRHCRSIDAAGKAIENALLGEFDRFDWQVFVTQAHGELCQGTRYWRVGNGNVHGNSPPQDSRPPGEIGRA